MKTTRKPEVKVPSKKLALNKETLKRLGDTDLERAAGGASTLTMNACTSRPTGP